MNIRNLIKLFPPKKCYKFKRVYLDASIVCRASVRKDGREIDITYMRI